METFPEFQRRTCCPFARTARITLAPAWRPDLGFEANVALHASALGDFVRVGQAHRRHGFVASVGIGLQACDFSAVRTTFRDYLIALSSTDESCGEVMRADKLNREWQFTYAGCRMFLNVFSSCYADDHSKYINSGASSFYVFFQPEYSFGMCGSGKLEIGAKYEIRKRFQAAGMPYDGALIDRRIEALIYMFPLRTGDEPVVWWE